MHAVCVIISMYDPCAVPQLFLFELICCSIDRVSSHTTIMLRGGARQREQELKRRRGVVVDRPPSKLARALVQLAGSFERRKHKDGLACFCATKLRPSYAMVQGEQDAARGSRLPRSVVGQRRCILKGEAGKSASRSLCGLYEVLKV